MCMFFSMIMGELAVAMDCPSTDSPLADEAYYFDGTNSMSERINSFNPLDATPSIVRSHEISQYGGVL